MSSANFNPYVQGWRVEQPSIFGAIPGANGHGSGVRGGGDSAADAGAGADPNATIFHITDFHPNVLNASVVDARGYQCYKIVTDAPQQPQHTVFYDMHRRTVALIDWAGVRPSVEMPGLLPRQALRRWLRAGPDRTSKIMEFRGIPHIWVPDGECICLYYANHSDSQRLGRIYLTPDAVRIELSQHAMEARLAEVCILSASVFLSGFKIDTLLTNHVLPQHTKGLF